MLFVQKEPIYVLWQALNSGAHLIELRRTRVGDIRVEDCLTIQDFEKMLEKIDDTIDNNL